MRTDRRIAAAGASLFALFLMAAAPVAAPPSSDQIAATAMSGRVLTLSELDAIYSGRTWYWKNGAAYFRPNRRFQAWVKEGSDLSYGEGSWSVSSNGQLCIRAIWAAVSGNTDAFTCYVHRASAGIYQRELPRGSWYLFSHTPPQPGDEIQKLERGDHISADFLRAKRYVARNRTGARRDGANGRQSGSP